MRDLLGEEVECLLSAYDVADDPSRGPWHGIRANTLKAGPEAIFKALGRQVEAIPWAPGGFYSSSTDRPCKHAYYHAGLYYVQEPTAMAPAEALDARPGERVLDLCAAPGGKSTQLAAALRGEGVLVANDIASERVKPLTKNLELAGARNAIITNETPEALGHVFPAWFDKVLVDAPCSGEGMFRRDPQACRSWQSYSCERCAELQREILPYAAAMLRPGGRMVYSTCTFEPSENEGAIAWLLGRHPELTLIQAPMAAGVAAGRPEWADASPDLARAARYWPHLVRGEGHFVAVMQKCASSEAPAAGCTPPTREGGSCAGGEGDSVVRTGPVGRHSPKAVPTRANAGSFAQTPRGGPRGPDGRSTRVATIALAPPDGFAAFRDSILTDEGRSAVAGTLAERGGNIYLVPSALAADPDTLERAFGLKLARPGWFLGSEKSGRFEPSAAMATALAPRHVREAVDLASDGTDVYRYLKCETLPPLAGCDGWTMISTDGYSLGWAKQAGGTLRNHYPSWWRWSD